MKDFKIKNGHCFITRYQRGQGLDTYSDNMNPVKKGKTLPSIFKQIAKGVAYLESIGLSHGDLKPDNIIITNRGVDEGPKVTIIDFDLSSQLEYSWIGSLKPQAIPASSFQYRSPESFAHTKISLTKLHTWAIGACLYRCLTGRNPFQSILDNAKDYKEAYALYKQTMLAIIRYPNLLSGYITVPTDFITASTWNPLIGQMHKLMTVDPKERPNVSQYLTDLDENGVQT
ncbi:kinase-like domain-containing protein [Syncephalis fuscata]|nr:kinase-like domain-containing protein [Syncephalis fuscata]